MEPSESPDRPPFSVSPGGVSRSERRAPVVHVFNPFVEGHVAWGTGFAPVHHQVQLERDLSNLPQFLCRRDDIVIVRELPSPEFLTGIRRAGFALPEFVVAPAMSAREVSSALGSRELGGLRPWGWGPDALALFEAIAANATAEHRPWSERFTPATAQLYSKAWSADFLRRWLAELRADTAEGAESVAAEIFNVLCPLELVGVPASTLDAVMRAVSEIRARGHHRVVLKQAIGLAGRNSIRLWEPDWLEPQRAWVEGALAGGRSVVVEPWLDRVLDFSVQMEMRPSELHICGFTGLINDHRGQFQGNWAAADCAGLPPSQISGWFPGISDVTGQVARLFARLAARLEPELRAARFLGPVGIDAFVYRAADGRCGLKPVVEINPRTTMGRLTVELMHHVAPGRHGEFRILNAKSLRESGAADFVSFARRLTEALPLRLDGESTPKIAEGALCLNDPTQATAVLATLHVTG